MTQAGDALASSIEELQDFWTRLPDQQKAWTLLAMGIVLILLALRKNVETEGWFLFYGFTGLICLAYAASLVISHGS
ncbi:MAG TPA: hypothetical protein VEF03_08240 [Candidatus Binataceae bacterium]|nr:hypothetical protein [Candidatus Binataceae bacterium]